MRTDDDDTDLPEDVSKYVSTVILRQADVDRAVKGEAVEFNESMMQNYYVPQNQYDKTHANVEDRLHKLSTTVDRHSTILETHNRRVTVVESRIKDVEIEQKVSKAERVGMLAILQAMEKQVIETALAVHKIEHLQMFGWMCVGLLLFLVLFKVW
jgi:hypothetical protein